MSEVVRYTPEKVREDFGVSPAQIPDLKGLMGDASDNIPGIPGIGEARKQALLKRFGTVKAIEAASLDDLRKLLPAPAASAVYAHLHPQEPPKTQKD